MRYHCTCTSTNQTCRILIQLNNSPPCNVFFTLYTQLIFHSPVLWNRGLITADPRVLTGIVPAVVLMVVLPCLWPGQPAPQHSAACPSLPPGGQVWAMQRPGTDCSSSVPPSPLMRSRIHKPGRGEEKNFHFLSTSSRHKQVELKLI